MSEKESILARVREALRTKAPVPGRHGVSSRAAGQQGHGGIDHGGHRLKAEPHDSVVTPGRTELHTAREWLPRVGESFEERLALFQKNATDLRAVFQLLNGEQELRDRLAQLRDAEGWKKIGSHAGELTEIACRAIDLPVCRTDEPYDVRGLESCDVGISECDALIAQTGSVLITARSAGGRALSVLPPHHVVIARREQLLADLPGAFELLNKKHGQNYPSFISIITGASRTGDIERTLVLGAHGPRKLTIFCL